MSVTRINEFVALDGRAGTLKALLRDAAESLALMDSCIEAQVLQSQDDPSRIVVLEVWTSAEAHRAAAEMIPNERLARVMELLAKPPRGEYFND